MAHSPQSLSFIWCVPFRWLCFQFCTSVCCKCMVVCKQMLSCVYSMNGMCVSFENMSVCTKWKHEFHFGWTVKRFDGKESSCKGSVRFSILCVRFSVFVCAVLRKPLLFLKKRVLTIVKNCKCYFWKHTYIFFIDHCRSLCNSSHTSSVINKRLNYESKSVLSDILKPFEFLALNCFTLKLCICIFLPLNLSSNFEYVQCCEKVFAPFLVSYFFAYLSHLNGSDHQTNFNISTNITRVNTKCSF